MTREAQILCSSGYAAREAHSATARHAKHLWVSSQPHPHLPGGTASLYRVVNVGQTIFVMLGGGLLLSHVRKGFSHEAAVVFSRVALEGSM